MPLPIDDADLDDPAHAAAIAPVLDSYASDPIGGGRPLGDEVRAQLLPGLRRHPTTLVLLAFDGGAPVGIAVCFFGSSTVQARPLLQVHDLAVVPARRGRGSAVRCWPRPNRGRARPAAASSPWRCRTTITAPGRSTRASASPTSSSAARRCRRAFSASG